MKEICEQLEVLAQKWGRHITSSYLQGILIGELCGAQKLTPSDFIGALLQELEVTRLQERELALLYGLFDQTAKGIASSDCNLKLCIPEEAALHERAAAVQQWCEGYLYGFGISYRDKAPLQEDVQDYLETLTDVAAIDLAALEGQEDDQLQGQLEEIVEFLRVGAMAVYEFLHPVPSQKVTMDTIPEPTHKTIQ